MRGISTINLLGIGSAFALSLLFTNQSFGQATTMCGEITAAFSSGPEGFTGAFTYGNGQLEKAVPRNVNEAQTYTIISPAYQKQISATTVYAGFTLEGYTRGTEYQVEVYSTTNILLATSPKLQVSDNPQANRPATICQPITSEALSGVGGVSYHIIIYSPDPVGNSPQDVVIKFDNFSIGNTAGITLPVNFKDFRGKKVAKGTQLTWNVAEEENVSRYEVQKGTNAGNLKTIGIVFAGENTSYSFTDEQASQGVTYYRIKSVDTDGKFKFSTMISFANGQTAALLRAFPMPARNQVTLQHGAIEGKAQISISSENGAILKRVVPSIGSMQTSIDLSTLKSGLYLLRLESSNGEIQTLIVVKQ